MFSFWFAREIAEVEWRGDRERARDSQTHTHTERERQRNKERKRGIMPPKKKGTSAEEKRRMLQAKVMESASFFNAKELEKMAATVGISGMSFKAELQTMLDEDMLVVDKVGAGNYYWKLPGDAANAIAKVCGEIGWRIVHESYEEPANDDKMCFVAALHSLSARESCDLLLWQSTASQINSIFFS